MLNHKYTYVITGDGMKAMVVHSDLEWHDFKDLVAQQTTKLNVDDKGRDTVWRWGSQEFINPVPYILSDWACKLPALIGVE